MKFKKRRPQLNATSEKEGWHLVHFVQPRSALLSSFSALFCYGELSVSHISTALLLIYRLCLLRYTTSFSYVLKKRW